MSGKARVYGVLAAIGFVVPLALGVKFIDENGLDLGLMLDQITASTAGKLVLADLTISAVVFLIWSAGEAPKAGISWWPYLLGTLLVGLCFAFPLFLMNRERRAVGATGPATAGG